MSLFLGGPNPYLHPLNTAKVLGERCKLASGVWGGAPAESEYRAL